MERAIAYIRVSTDRQATDGTSLTTQQRKVDEHVGGKGYEFDRLFVEEGESAKTDKRPVLQEMLAYVKKNQGRIQVCIFPKVDRFARYAEDYFFLKGYLRKLGIRVESTDERFDDSPVGRYMEGMLAVTAQFDNEIRAERSKGGMVEAALAGRYVGGRAPVGFRNCHFDNRPNIEPDPVNGPLMAQAFDRLAWRGFRPVDVRLWLAKHGVVISRSNFHRAIRRLVYIGQIDRFGVRRQGAPPFLPLVSEATFYKAQEAFEPRDLPKTYQRDREEFPLRGTAKCLCGSFLMAGFSQGRSRLYSYYRCKYCPKTNLASGGVETAFVQLLSLSKRRYLLSRAARQNFVELLEEERAADRLRQTQIEKEIASLEAVQQSLAVKVAQGVVPDRIAKEQFQDLDRKIGEKKVQLKDCQAGDAPWEQILDFSDSFLPELDQRWRHGDLSTKKHIQTFFFEHGATVVKTTGRTAFRTLPTGLDKGPNDPLLHAVHCKPTNSNPISSKQRRETSSADLLRLYLRLFQEFGQDS